MMWPVWSSWNVELFKNLRSQKAQGSQCPRNNKMLNLGLWGRSRVVWTDLFSWFFCELKSQLVQSMVCIPLSQPMMVLRAKDWETLGFGRHTSEKPTFFNLFWIFLVDHTALGVKEYYSRSFHGLARTAPSRCGALSFLNMYHLGVSINGGTPIAGFFMRENIKSY